MAKTATKATGAKPATKTTEKPAASTPSRPAQTAQRPSVPATVKNKPADEQHTGSQSRSHSNVPAEVREQLPAHMRNDVDMGKENIQNSDMDIPRLKLMQGPSKELTLYDDLRPGNFFHTASETIFDEPVRVVPVFFDRQYILWRPLEDGGGILARAVDGQHWSPSSGEFEVKLDKKDGGAKVKWKLAPTVEASGLALWGTMDPNNNQSPPAATLMYNFVLAFPDNPDMMPAVLTFQRSSIRIGRKFMTKLKTVRTPIFGSVFTLSAFDDHNAAKQDYKNISLTGAGLVTDPEQYEMYKGLYLSLSKSGLNVRDIDSLQDEPDSKDGGDDNQDENRPGY